MKKEYILDIIKRSDTILNAKDIYNIVKEKIDINLSTVYRILNGLVEKKIITKITRNDNTAYYTLASNNPKEYMVCDICNSSYTTDTIDVEKLRKKIKKETGFNITSNVVELHGICRNCRKKIST